MKPTVSAYNAAPHVVVHSHLINHGVCTFGSLSSRRWIIISHSEDWGTKFGEKQGAHAQASGMKHGRDDSYIVIYDLSSIIISTVIQFQFHTNLKHALIDIRDEMYTDHCMDQLKEN